MWLDTIALGVMAVFIGLGVLRGGFVTGMSLVSLGAAYGAAILTAPRLGPTLAESLGLPEILGLPLAGSAAFLLTYTGLGLVTRLMRRRRPFGRSLRDRFLGGVFGAVRGALVVLLLGLLASFVEALRVSGSPLPLPELGRSTAAALTESVVEAGVEAAISPDNPARRVVAKLASRPAQAVVGLRALLESPQLDSLRDDSLFWTYIEHGSVDTALNRASFVGISRDPSLRRRFAELGLIDTAAAEDPSAFRDAIAGVIRELAPRLEGLRDDPALQQILEDPAVTAMLRDGDTAGLVRHPGVRKLAARLASEPPRRTPRSRPGERHRALR